MAIPSGKHALGPENGSLHLRTGRAGMAAKAGHDLLIRVGRWSGSVDVPDSEDLAAASLTVTIEMDSLEVVEGTGGATKLDDRDRADIRRNAAKVLNVARHPIATFTSTEMRPTTGEIVGTLDLAGASAPLVLAITEGNSGWRASATVVQTEFGITPYRALMGALKLADPVAVEAEVRLLPS